MNRRWNKYLLLILLCGICTEMFAAGTPAGTVIQSRSRVIFTSRNGSQIDTVYSSVVSITVAQKAAWNLTPALNAITTQSDSTIADYPVILTNSGNGADIANVSANSSKGWTAQIFVDGNSDGILQAGEISAGIISRSVSVNADAQFAIIIRVKVPRGESMNGMIDTTTVVVKANFDSTVTNSGKNITFVRTSGLNPLTPGLSVNNPIPTAGQQVTYSFTLTNSGSVPANNLSIREVIPGGCTFISSSSTMGTFNGGTIPIVWNIGTLSPSQSVTVSLTIQVSSGVTPGTVIPNQFGIFYSTASNAYAISSNSVPITIGGLLQHGVSLTPMIASLTKEASDTAWYSYSVRNTGSFKDLIELSMASSQNISWKFYRDGNSNGQWDIADKELINTNDSAGVDIDSVAAGDSVRIFVMTTVPRLDNDQLKDSLQIVATSGGDHSKFDSKISVTTINIPVVTLMTSILPAGDQPAGSIMTYIITYTNSGSADVKSFSIVDPVPNATNYVVNSVKVNGVAVSDNSGGVSITKDLNNTSVVSVSIGTLTAHTNGSIEFKVKIK